VIQDLFKFSSDSDPLFDQVAHFTLGDNLFGATTFPPVSKQRTQSKIAPVQARRIESVTIYPLRIPFHQAFRHALQNREESDAVIVKVTGSDGRSGFGESLPRSYVTGETTDTMVTRIRDHWRQKSFVKPSPRMGNS